MKLVDPLTWHVVHTQAGKENLAARSLEDAGYIVFYPWYLGEVSHARKRYSVTRPYFPRYMFIGLREGQGTMAANTSRGVSAVLFGTVGNDRNGSVYGPLKLNQDWIDGMKAKCDESGQVLGFENIKRANGRQARKLTEGQEVIILDGPLKGLPGKARGDDGASKTVTVDIILFGTPMSVSVNIEELRAA